MSTLTFTVYGTPIPKGSTKAFVPKGWKRAIITHDNPRTKGWQQEILEAALVAIAGASPLDGPVALTLRFYLPKPKSAPRRVVDAVKKPDLDKLVRCVKDGLTRAGIYHDDSQVTLVTAGKFFAGGLDDADGHRGVPRVVVIVGARARLNSQSVLGLVNAVPPLGIFDPSGAGGA
jgi:Holliday junction resolvase RusA-like endonuclease